MDEDEGEERRWAGLQEVQKHWGPGCALACDAGEPASALARIALDWQQGGGQLEGMGMALETKLVPRQKELSRG